jgi:hypothetical protein
MQFRQPVPRSAKPTSAQVKSFPAPTSGLIANQNRAIASERMPNGQLLRGAALLENWFPTQTGIRMRAGTEKFATIGDGEDDVAALFSYRAGNNAKLFAATDDAIYDITSPADADVSPSADVDTLSGGDWATVQFATSGGTFLVAVNGEDDALNYDGTDWETTPAITNVSSDTLSYVSVFKRRLWFTQKDSLSLWYLTVDAIGGAATEFPMAGVFNRGGSILFTTSISMDSGDGLDDRFVIVSTEGEFAVYEGTDPGTAADWRLVGVYQMGRPRGKHSHMRAGGDRVVATDIGFVPIIAAMQIDPAALSPRSVSAPIETLWVDYVRFRGGSDWYVNLWPSRQMAMVALPTPTSERVEMLVANVQTGAWTVFTGWEALCLETFGSRCFFGSTEGRIYECEVTGADDGMPYTASYVPLFDDLKSPASRKIAHQARAMLLAPRPPGNVMSVQADFEIDLPVVPSGEVILGESLWGAAIWGESPWGELRERKTFKGWQSTFGTGTALAAAVQITSGSVAPPDIDLVRIDMTYETADIVT